jgi:hypothetical protein
LKLGTGSILVSVVRSIEDRFRLEKNVLVETARWFDFHALLILSRLDVLAKHVDQEVLKNIATPWTASYDRRSNHHQIRVVLTSD